MKVFNLSIILLVFFGLWSCDNNKTDLSDPSSVTGTGAYTFDNYAPLANKPIDCFYHIPNNSTSSTPIMIVLPGAGRDASVMRDGLIQKADQKGFIVLALRFSEVYYPGSDAYNMANIFEDGDDPTPNTENPEEEWTFSPIDPIFDDFKGLIGSNVPTYDVFGHSAGAQLVHRFLIYNNGAKFNRVVASAAGWYNMPDTSVTFPYGLDSGPSIVVNLQEVFVKKTYVIVGADDVDPNSFNLRHTDEADLQGMNRLERAQYFYIQSREIAQEADLQFNWQYSSVPNTGHEGVPMANFAADKLY